MTFLYHIHLPEEYGNLKSGYIGVTDNPDVRFQRHASGYSGSPILNRAFQKYNNLCFTLISSGTRDQMLTMEEWLRPNSLGWNAVKGGGNPPNQIGKTMSESQKANIGKANERIQKQKKTEVWVCDGVEFLSKLEASRYFNVTRKTIKDRCDNPKFINWFRKER